ncbi:MAG: endopeptidase La [Flavobacteriales bacterium]|nr:endopeptidase La [Flavobacteriales bacterium]
MNDPFEDIVSFSNLLEEDSEFIPLLSPEDEESMNAEDIPELVGILPLRNTVLFPGVVIPITIGRDKSIKLVKEAYNSTRVMGVLAQKDVAVEDPQPKDMNRIGTVARIIKMLQMPDGSTTVIIQGKRRFEVQEIVEVDPYFKATIKAFDEIKPIRKSKEFNALVDSLKDIALKIIKQSPNIPSESEFALRNIESPSFLINFISSNMDASVAEKQKMLEVADLRQRAVMVLEQLTRNLQMLELKNDIQSKVKVDIDKQQREYFLNQQMKQIQEELGVNSLDQEVDEMRKKAANKKWSAKISEHFQKELDKLGRMNPSAGEYSVQMNYLDTLLELPWGDFTKDNFDIKHAQKVLDRDHFGLKKVKERILEHLAVLKLKGDMKAPILCLVGPPGVGKTSLGKSIAEAVGRQYIRVSLGGLKDESEVRGHRKTYIGAMPGRIIQNIKKAKSSNPVFVLDELDKVGNDFHGDPSSALLEVLDPEQNETFYDNYLEVEYDLSKVMFIATANSLSTIQPALRDRLEIIEVSGYTVEEKLEIAKRHLLPKQIEEHGLKKADVKLSKQALEKVIEEYTRESGVRGLEKTIAKLVRNRAKFIALEEPKPAVISLEEVEEILGPPKVQRDRYSDNSFAGVVTGLAWTAVGGDILFIESSLSRGKGKLTLTGNLGEVMKESAVIALEYLKSHADKLGLKPEVFDNWNLHIHVPEGATPKDGPSAGITIFTALASLYTQRKVRDKLAMTGEITLRGKVLPVGGIKEKILAAKRAKIKEIILCDENRKDVEEIEEDYLKGLTFHYVSNMDEVIARALLKQKIDNPLTID